MTEIKTKIATMLELPVDIKAQAIAEVFGIEPVGEDLIKIITGAHLLGNFEYSVSLFKLLESKLEPEQGRDLEELKIKSGRLDQYDYCKGWNEALKAVQELQQPKISISDAEIQKTIEGLANPDNFMITENEGYGDYEVFDAEKTIKTLTDFVNWLKKESSK